MNCNDKLISKRKAFTLIELLIVIAIIGILFIVLVSKVDFATDKAKATGVQTDFRSFQVAIESVAKENAGLATFGWDTGDTNGDRIRNSYDKGDTNKNGIQDDGEVFVGSKTYGETWTNVYTLTNPADANDKSAIAALESAINANLDPKLHITIADDLTITMTNGAQDPWDTEYHGYYITNAVGDNMDRGAIVIYSNGVNQEWGSEHSISGGIVTINVPENNVYGKDDYSLSVIYTYMNGYGEIKTTTSGFSNNQGGGQAGTEGTFTPDNGGTGGTPGGEGGGNTSTPDDEQQEPSRLLEPGLYSSDGTLLVDWETLTKPTEEGGFGMDISKDYTSSTYNTDVSSPYYVLTNYNNGTLTTMSASNKNSYTLLANLDDNESIGTKLVIDKSVTKIGDYAFYKLTQLKELDIDSNIVNFGYCAFSGCTELTTVYITTMDYWCNSIFENGSSTPLCYATTLYINGKSVNEVVVPEGITTIPNYAFYGCPFMEKVTIASSVTAINDSFSSNLKAINIKDIEAWCNIDFLSSRYNHQFCYNPLYYAKHLYLQDELITDLVIPDNVTTIKKYAFFGADLNSVTFNKNLTTIGRQAFQYCTIPSIEIPNNITTIGDGAFLYCDNLESVYITDLVAWCNIDFGGTSANPLYNECKLYLNNNIVSELIIPTEITDIKENAFINCTSIQTITWNNVKTIGEEAFSGSSITGELIVPEGITNIGTRAFAGCDFITSAYIPDSVEVVDWAILSVCRSLESVSLPFVGRSKNETDMYSDDIYFAYPLCGTQVLSTSKDFDYFVNLKIYGSTYSFPKSFNHAIIRGGPIYPQAFMDFTILSSIELCEGVESIGGSAFKNCTGLSTITIPGTVESIGSNAFYGCSELTSVVFGNGIKTIGSSAFERCTKITNIIIPGTVESVGYYAFRNCSNLTDVVINDGVKKLGWSSFANCTKLTNVTIGSGLEERENSIFSGCSSKLTTIKFNGTMDEWESVAGPSNWVGNSYTKTLECLDGTMCAETSMHKGGSATCIEKAICTTCNRPYGKLSTSHTGGTATCLQPKNCSLCGVAYGDVVDCSGGMATCIKKANCQWCGNEYGNFVGCANLSQGTCKLCGKTGITEIVIESAHNPYAKNQNYFVLGTWDCSDAKSVTITITYQTGSVYSDWVVIKKGNTYTAGSSSMGHYLRPNGNVTYTSSSSNGSTTSPKFSSSTQTTKTFSNLTNMLTGCIIFKTDDYQENYYGVKVVITPNY